MINKIYVLFFTLWFSVFLIAQFKPVSDFINVNYVQIILIAIFLCIFLVKFKNIHKSSFCFMLYFVVFGALNYVFFGSLSASVKFIGLYIIALFISEMDKVTFKNICIVLGLIILCWCVTILLLTNFDFISEHVTVSNGRIRAAFMYQNENYFPAIAFEGVVFFFVSGKRIATIVSLVIFFYIASAADTRFEVAFFSYFLLLSTILYFLYRFCSIRMYSLFAFAAFFVGVLITLLGTLGSHWIILHATSIDIASSHRFSLISKNLDLFNFWNYFFGGAPIASDSAIMLILSSYGSCALLSFYALAFVSYRKTLKHEFGIMQPFIASLLPFLILENVFSPFIFLGVLFVACIIAPNKMACLLTMHKTKMSEGVN